MRTLKGLGISPGFAQGSVYYYENQPVEVILQVVQDTKAEWARLEAALQIAQQQLTNILAIATESAGAGEGEIFSAHLLILEDPELLERLQQEIEGEHHNAEYAWYQGTEHYANLLANLDDEYLSARCADVRDVAQRVLRILAGKTQGSSRLQRPAVVFAEELTPSDTLTFDRGKVLAFCTAKGGPTSHVAILSKALGIPAVTRLDMCEVQAGDFVIVDGTAGEIILDPDDVTRNEFHARAERYQQKFTAAFSRTREPAITADGKRIEVVANIGSVGEASGAVEFGAEGVGLLRTEFLFLDREIPPDEDEQVDIYRNILAVFGKQPVVIRTLDIGGDKPAPYLNMQAELNPFLGVRGTRLGLTHPPVFRTQLRALLRASPGYNMKIMFPMIATLAEVRAAYTHLVEVEAELDAAGIAYDLDVEIGIMVEIPSAAIMADILAPEVDFFSLGTNDLSQYTLAADRTNPEVASLADALDPAVLRLIELVTRAAHAQDRWVGLCGELAGDPLAVPVLLGLGVDEFSMNPRAVPFVKEAIRRFSLDKAREISQKVLQLSTAAEVREYLEQIPSLEVL